MIQVIVEMFNIILKYFYFIFLINIFQVIKINLK
jgi:hypothetical protein